MTYEQLLAEIDKPETHQALVGNSDVYYGVGAIETPLSLILRVSGSSVSYSCCFPETIEINGEIIPVIIKYGYKEIK